MKTQTKHTQGKWRVKGANLSDVLDIVCDDGSWIMSANDASWMKSGEAEANTARAVDCVNACESLADPSVVREIVHVASAFIDASQSSPEFWESLPVPTRTWILNLKTTIARAKGEV